MTAAYKCHDCEEEYETVKALTKHARNSCHKAFRCGYCSDKFMNGDEVLRHTRKVHLPKWPFQCPLCTKKATSEMGLIEHFKAKHDAEELFPCRLCVRLFSTSVDLEDHRDLAHPQETAVPEVDGSDESLLSANAAVNEESMGDFQSAYNPSLDKDLSSVLPLGVRNDKDAIDADTRSGPIGEESASSTTNADNVPGSRERSSSLVASDSGSSGWSEVGRTLSDVNSVDSERELKFDVEAHCTSSEAEDCPGGRSELTRAPQKRPNAANARTTAGACQICELAPTSPVVTACGHLFCRGCIIAELPKDLSCPACERCILVQVDM
ncbi:hypothetical protein PHLGIDRAFT_130740 [Phlebiopsis gigantea 11061_1 CR5-6]|uniref:RING-type domain-containing protein n=1 Tax=Phlebiopsis gigantea (strain 11061_1 CR5-6) TaxID=745531 RepID=A0A0C3PBS0_PHLG1|nr:hypothetical protein PHLGIDRAFT_130740 [Phlebiopsis gigantea 11061_1 CR5-6]